MALYPTPPGERMAYDRDGSAPFVQPSGGTVSSLSNAQAQIMNNESSDTTGIANPNVAGSSYCGVVFPELRDLYGYFLSQTSDGGSTFTLQTSTDTTSGIDGTWTNQGTPPQGNGGNYPVVPNYRSAIITLSVTNIKGIRLVNYNGYNINLGWDISAWHFYGQPSANQDPDSLRIWQPSINAEVTTVFDFGDIARSTSAIQTFRIKNMSSTRTASGISISLEALTDTNPGQANQYSFSTDNITYASTINLSGSLGPGAISPIMYIRNNPPTNAQTGVAACRMVVVPALFT